MDSIVSLTVSFVGFDGSHQLVTMTENGIIHGENNRLTTTEMILITELAKTMRELFLYKSQNMQQKAAQSEAIGNANNTPINYIVH